jgi:hypothetical protein
MAKRSFSAHTVDGDARGRSIGRGGLVGLGLVAAVALLFLLLLVLTAVTVVTGSRGFGRALPQDYVVSIGAVGVHWNGHLNQPDEWLRYDLVVTNTRFPLYRQVVPIPLSYPKEEGALFDRGLGWQYPRGLDQLQDNRRAAVVEFVHSMGDPLVWNACPLTGHAVETSWQGGEDGLRAAESAGASRGYSKDRLFWLDIYARPDLQGPVGLLLGWDAGRRRWVLLAEQDPDIEGVLRSR